jgi:hypothetical protein
MEDSDVSYAKDKLSEYFSFWGIHENQGKLHL